MAGFIIDANLPRYFSLWSGGDYEYVVYIDDRLKDSEIWAYARQNALTIYRNQGCRLLGHDVDE